MGEEEGKFSSVLKKEKITLWGSDVVVKRLRSRKPEMGEPQLYWNYIRFENEFRLEVGMMGKLRHPNICLLLAASYDRLGKAPDKGADFYLITEKMDTNLIFGATFPPVDILDVAVQISKAVNYLHHQSPPIIHGDITANNIFTSKSTGKIIAKLGDFGIASFPKISQLAGNSRFRAEFDDFDEPCEGTDIIMFGEVFATVCKQFPNKLPDTFKVIIDNCKMRGKVCPYKSFDKILTDLVEVQETREQESHRNVTCNCYNSILQTLLNIPSTAPKRCKAIDCIIEALLKVRPTDYSNSLANCNCIENIVGAFSNKESSENCCHSFKIILKSLGEIKPKQLNANDPEEGLACTCFDKILESLEYERIKTAVLNQKMPVQPQEQLRSDYNQKQVESNYRDSVFF